MVAYFKDGNGKSKQRLKLQYLKTILKTADTFVNNATTATFVKLSITALELTVIPISIGIVHLLVLNNKVLYEILTNKDKKY